MTSHLIIPDPHSHPDYDNKRFKWLGKLVCDLKPDVVVSLGDWADMPSLCTYDRGTKGFEGRRYAKDIAHVNQSLDMFFSPIRKRKKKLPRFVMLHGNHEHRIDRAISTDAAHLDGIISMGDLGYRRFGWEEVPYEGATPGTILLDGVCYSHYLTSGLMGRPISGINPASSLLTKKMMSCTVGHSHIRDMASRTRADGVHINGLVAGCCFEFSPSFAGITCRDWWRGVVMKHEVENGQYDHQWISLKAIKKEYS